MLQPNQRLRIVIALADVRPLDNTLRTDRVKAGHSERLETRRSGGCLLMRIKGTHDELNTLLHRFRCQCDSFTCEHAQ
jgi:hypothetical protein